MSFRFKIMYIYAIRRRRATYTLGFKSGILLHEFLIDAKPYTYKEAAIAWVSVYLLLGVFAFENC